MRYLLSLLVMSFGVHVIAQGPAPRIPVVKTWEELQAAPAIDLGGGVKIRLGLEVDKAPRWSGVLLYCLAEGYAPPPPVVRNKLPFGPVHVDVVFENENRAAEKMKLMESINENHPKGTYLYVRTVAVDRIGTYRAAVTDSQGKLLATASIAGTNDVVHPWTPWHDGREYAVAPWTGIALPNVDGIGPAAFLRPGETKKGKLPTLVLREEKPLLTIHREGPDIVIRAESEFTTSRPELHFLARWWVNGKPFVPKQTDAFWLFDRSGRVLEDKELKLPLRFQPDRLGAKAGDTIGLQLMHCESGWSWCTQSTLAKFDRSRHVGENVRVSNRIDFVASKD